MWAVENQTRFATERTFVRDRDGSEIWLVAVRATFDILPTGELRVSKVQDSVVLAPQYLGEPGHSSLRCDSDLPRTKPGTDVLLNGYAYAPGGKPVPHVLATLSVGSIKKTLAITGDRTWSRGVLGWKVNEPQPFTKMPITYERAFGGKFPDDATKRQLERANENPVGVGLNPNEGAIAPNIEYPASSLSSNPTDIRIAGFGAISCAWTPRRQLAGTYDEAWQKNRQPLVPLDFQDKYFFSAPSDQQVPGGLRGGESVELRNLTPNGLLHFQLPRHTFGFRTSIDGGSIHHRGSLHTVLIEPEYPRLIMVWHTSLPCHHTLYTLMRTVVFEKERLSEQDSHSEQAAA